MTPTPHLNSTPTPEGEASRPYEAPTLTTLGTVNAVTAGPDGDKNIDMIVGDEGGFARQDGTS